MIEREKVMRGLECCMRENNTNMCGDCPYHDSSETRFGCMRSAMRDALALLKEQELEIKGLRKLVEWAVECDFGYDNLGDWWVDRFKSEIEGMSYTEGLIHLAKRYVEVFEGGDGDD